MPLMKQSSSPWSLLALGLAMCLALAPAAACAGAGQAGSSADHGEDGGGENDSGGGEHIHPAGEEIPKRADETDRDEYSHPMEVYAFGGIDSGDTVVDIGAGSGYNTFLLSGIVGATGKVIAERGNEGLAARIEYGDLVEAGNVTIAESRAAVPSGSADAIVLIREYHLAEDYLELMADLQRILKDDGVLVVVEVRNNEAEGHNMTTHRLGEQTVINQFADGGFTLADESDLLRRDDDDYSVYGGPMNVRYITDRMLMKFVKTP